MILIEYKILTILLYFNTIFGIFGKHLINTKNKNDDYCSNKLLCAKNEMINKPNNFDKIGELSRSKKTALCDACYLAVPIALKFVAENKTEHIKPFIVFICNEFKIESQMVCDLVVKEYADIVIAVAQDSKLEASDYCDVGLNCGTSENPLLNWNITLPNVPKPPIIKPTPPQPGSPTLRILHLSDIHIDFEYKPDSPADCLDPLCCRKNSTPNPKSKYKNTGAGYWGDYRNCDIPLWTVENMFDYISKNENFDFIYWTGDLPPHNVWNQTKNDQLLAVNVLTSLFLKYFQKKVIYPAIGNHEGAPCNIFPPPYVKEDNIEWLYTSLAKNWTATGLPLSLVPDIQKGAYYSMLLYPGIRLISLNMNYCASLNFWLFINTTDPLQELEWLSNTLQYSEDHGELVHIIGHINPNGCLSSWSSNYYRIINRYENIIRGQFFGHTHDDEIELFYDLNNITRSTNMAYLGPSVTTFSFKNPSYRIYTVDGFYSNTTWRVLDHETHYLNITEANISNVTKWKMEYSAKASYGLENLFPQDWSDLVDYLLLHLEDPRARMFFNFLRRSEDVDAPCNNDCLINILCNFKQANSAITIPCIHE